MSFMPNAGTVVRMTDGRIAVVSKMLSSDDGERVTFADGHEEETDPWQIAEMLTEEPENDNSVEPLPVLLRWLSEVRR